MEYEFDPNKDFLNRRKHGMPLANGKNIFNDDNHIILPSIRKIDGEERFKVIGKIDHKFHTAIYVWRNNKIRFISVRRSNNGEEKQYRTSFGSE